jgi:hypothetical protein
MAHVNLSTEEAEIKMADALRIAMSAWKKAGMPWVSDQKDADYHKIALAQLACKLFDALD